MSKEEMKSRKEKVFADAKNGYDRVSEAELTEMESYCAAYRDYLDRGKTERLCVRRTVELAQAAGFVPYRRGMALCPGDKVYSINRGKGVMLAVIGRKSLGEGCQITASHIDSPRLDIKPVPLYEEGEMAYCKTHYYGGIRKYQWVTIPLELRGVVAMKDGTLTEVALGEGDEPKFVITDLLPHLGAEQGKKPLNEAFPGENLNVLLGSRPVGKEGESDRVKLHVMEKLYEKYGMTEADFTSAELEIVPAGTSTELGLDGSLLGAYGHDDRVCGFAALKAMLDLSDIPAKTAVCVLADKEEIGSMGVTGMQSAAFDTFMGDLCESQSVPLRVCYENSFCLSTDVTAAYDPGFADVYDKRNAARINYGLGLCKYTGARGKAGASDAGAETVAYVRRILDEGGVVWQIGEMGKVDAGGGGTVAQYMANRNIATLDAGVPVLSMHAPFEVVSKLDCYMTYKGCKAVYEAE
ncbi:MAG: aminopeptidase [Oscillospiraceae bacterium]|nr:aminopeptidase [Oscillospiraceae bacterium]